MSGIVRGERKVKVVLELKIGPNDLTDEQVRMYYQGTANVLFFLLQFGMAQVPPPNAPITAAVVTVGESLDADRH